MAAPARRTTPGTRCPGLSLDIVWLAIVVAFPFVVLNFSALPADDGDLWWTLAQGSLIWTTGALPTSEPLAYTPTPERYTYAQWLGGLIFYGTYRLGGYPLLVVLRAAIVAAVFAVLYVGCRRAGAAPGVAGICSILALALVNGGLSMRPQLLALLPFILYLEATRHPVAPGSAWGRIRTCLPLVMVYWANVHGSFLLGMGLVGIAIVGRVGQSVGLGEAPFADRTAGLAAGSRSWLPQPVSKRLVDVRQDAELSSLLRLLLLSALALLINPYGLELMDYLRLCAQACPGYYPLGGLLTEWAPTTIDMPGGAVFFGSVAALLLVSVASVVCAGRRVFSFAELLRLLVFGNMAIRWLRAIVWWGLVVPAPLAGALQRALGVSVADRPVARRRANTWLVGLIAMVALCSLPWWRGGPVGQDSPAVTPSPLVAAVDGLVAEPAVGRPFHYIAWGPYLAWRGRPDTRIFVDGRYEAYEPTVFAEYASLSRGDTGWERRLDDYGVGYLLLSRGGQAGLVAAINASAAWELTFSEGDVVVYRRTGSASLTRRGTS
jgi:hypothetical protein